MTRGPSGYVGYCEECGKKLWASRKKARKAARIMHPSDPDMNAYRCLRRPGTGYWHIGHLSDDVKQGVKTRAVYRGYTEGL